MQIKLPHRHALYLFWTPDMALHVQKLLGMGDVVLAVQHERYHWLHCLHGEQDRFHSEGDALFMTLEPETVEYALWKLQEYLRTGRIVPAEFAELALKEKAEKAAPRKRRCVSCYWMEAVQYPPASS